MPLPVKDVASTRSEWFNNRMTRFLTVFFCWASLAMAGDKALRPNIILIMADDMGFSDIGCYGGEIQTPNLDRLAEHGLRYTQFYNTARCCPTRASLMTGLYAHQAGMGAMTRPTPLRGYQGHINRNCVTIAEVLKKAGYATFMSGKWHLTEDKNKQATGSKHNWPRQRGFDRFFGTIAGAGSFYTPQTLTLDNAPMIVLQFSCQQINCVRNKDGEIVEGAEDDIQSVHYLWAMQLEDVEYTHSDGRKYTAPTWQLREMVLRGMMAVAA